MTKIARLKHEARIACSNRGHDMGKFQLTPGARSERGFYPYLYFTAYCKRCPGSVTVTRDPAHNEIDIGGDALALSCPAYMP